MIHKATEPVIEVEADESPAKKEVVTRFKPKSVVAPRYMAWRPSASERKASVDEQSATSDNFFAVRRFNESHKRCHLPSPIPSKHSSPYRLSMVSCRESDKKGSSGNLLSESSSAASTRLSTTQNSQRRHSPGHYKTILPLE